jgi:hypothetical protein
VLVTAAALARHARADDAGHKAAAQVLFEQGRSLVLEKKFAEACPKFAESLRLDPGIGTMLWLADCYENNGQTASAWAQFKEAAATAALQHDPREKVARRRVEALEPRLAKLTLVPPAEGIVPGLEVRRDGIVVGNAEFGIPVPADPGIHTVAASAPGRKPWSSQVRVPPEVGLTSVTVPVLDKAELGDSLHDQAQASAQPEGPASDRPSGQTQRTLGIVTASAGVVVLGVGTYFGLHAKQTYDNASPDCPNNACDGAGRLARSDANSQATVATVLFPVGLAAVAAGVVLYVVAPRASSPSGVSVIPTMGAGGAGLTLAHAW